MRTELKKLHGDQSGGIAILLLLTVFVLVAMIGMIWNVGEYSVRRHRIQDAADSSAYSSTVWLSRGQNLVTGTNMAMIRNGSAMAIAEAHAVALATVFGNLVAKWKLFWNPQYWREWGQWGQMSWDLFEPIVNSFIDLPPRQRELSAYQHSIVQAIPGAIEQQRRKLESFHGVNVVLVQPGMPPAEGNNQATGSIRLPVKRSTGFLNAQFTIVLARRVSRDRESWDRDYDRFVIGGGRSAWNAGIAFGIGSASVYPRRNTYILETSSFLGDSAEVDESRAFSDDPFTQQQRLKYFTIVAVATPRFFSGPRPVLRQYFLRPRQLAAYAQAETFNPMNSSGLIRFRYNVQPWRLWSKAGWDWRPRLAGADGLRQAMENYPKFRSTLASGASNGQAHDLDSINNH